MLTKRQHDLMKFLQQYMKNSSIAPTVREMAAGIGLKSGSGIHRILSGLQERGFINRISQRARAIEVIREVK